MTRIQCLILGLAGTVLPTASHGKSHDHPQSAPIQGTWVVQSVIKDGSNDPTQRGARVTFTADKVTFASRVVEIDDWTS